MNSKIERHQGSVDQSSSRVDQPTPRPEARVLPSTGGQFGRYAQARSGFDRFLKLYHCLELLFDYVILKRMRAVGNDLAGFENIISAYSVNEQERLRYLIANYCDNKVALFSKYYPLSPHEDRATEIFQSHSKGGSPLEQDVIWRRFLKLCADGQLTDANMKRDKLAVDETSRDKLATNLSAYCIYRVRSSIAHSRVGEFLLLDSDEELVVTFAEPLLLEVVSQIFSNEALKAVLEA